MRAYVIGAGIVGLTAAFELAERGAEVTVFDPAPARGASSVAGGMLAPICEVQFRQEPLYPLMLESRRLWPDLLERVRARTGLPTGYRDEGTLVVAADRADRAHLEDITRHQEAHGMAARRITLRQARHEEPTLSPRLAGAVAVASDTQVNPRAFTAALIDALHEMGVRILPRRVDRLTIAGDRVTEIDGRSIDGTVVLATGLGRVAGWQDRLRLRPVFGDVVIARPREPLLRRVVRGFVETRPVYLIPRDDGTLVVGASTREDGRDRAPLGAIRQLLDDAVRILPGIEDADFVEVCTGARPGTPDDLPYIGGIGRNLVVSTGYFRHGILLAALGAKATAALALGDNPPIDLAACDPMRFD